MLLLLTTRLDLLPQSMASPPLIVLQFKLLTRARTENGSTLRGELLEWSLPALMHVLMSNLGADVLNGPVLLFLFLAYETP